MAQSPDTGMQPVPGRRVILPPTGSNSGVELEPVAVVALAVAELGALFTSLMNFTLGS